MPRPTRAAVATATATAPSMSISNFTRVSKTHNFPDAKLNKSIVTEATISRKRKASSDDNDDGDHARFRKRTVSFAPSDEEDNLSISKRACRRDDTISVKISAPVPVYAKGKMTAKKAKDERSHRPSATTIIASSRKAGQTTQLKIDAMYTKKQQTAAAAIDAALSDLPTELADLVRLHRAFLKTVMIQIAHTRGNAPLDMRELAPNVARSWGKRAVTVEDVRRCIAIQSSGEAVSPFLITDYGKGKICVELRPELSSSDVKEAEMCKQFEATLRRMCAERSTDRMDDVQVPLEGLSIADLPQADVKAMITAATMNPLLAKGQRALNDLKNGLVAKQQQKETKQTTATAGMLNPDGSKMSLLDRLRQKQVAAATAPQGPTTVETQRIAALNRVADVAATISMLSLSNPMSLPRQAFTMSVIADKLKDSMRVPVSKEEGTICVRLIAKEVAPEWLRVVTIGGRENVVIQRTGEPINRILMERVNRLLG